MRQEKLCFNHADINKISICFTWDDNCYAHIRLIAPQFLRRGFKCTFYVNPGKEGFNEKFASGYRELARQGFEIGSHSYDHVRLTGLKEGEPEHQIKASADGIFKSIGVYPTTFAFPYHDFDEHTLSVARLYHLETRNTLRGSVRFGVSTNSAPEEMFGAVRECVSAGQNIVFSGHSAVSDLKELSLPGCGYEPILLDNLNALLDMIQTVEKCAQVLMLEQAALKEYIISNCEIAGNTYALTSEQAEYLSAFGIDPGKLSRLI
ncbi:MAG: polysaccharide deacetylase family protein [Burkholderiales bacterium]